MNPYSFLEYEIINSKYKRNKKYKIFIVVFLIGIILFLSKFKFQIYEKNVLFKEDNGYFMVVDATKLDFYQNHKTLLINNIKYNYAITNIDSEYSNINGTIYQTIYLSLKNYDNNSNFKYCYFLIKSETLLKMIFEFITGGTS